MCTMAADKAMIEAYMKNDHQAVCSFVSNLIREQVRKTKMELATTGAWTHSLTDTSGHADGERRGRDRTGG